MASPFLQAINLESLSTSRLWQQLDRETRLRAAMAFYTGESRDKEVLQGADAAIAGALHFRLPSVRKLAPEKRASHLARSVRPPDPLATLLLQSLHLEHHRPLMSTFLDALGVKHENGHIAEDAELGELTPARLTQAAAAIDAKFSGHEVDVYLTSLLAMEPYLWSGLLGLLSGRKQA